MAEMTNWDRPVARDLMAGLRHKEDVHLEIMANEVRINQELHRACSDIGNAASTHRHLMHQLKASVMRLEYAKREDKWPLIELENRTIARLTPLEDEARLKLAGAIARWLSMYEPAR
jgi:hypothetical protein